jgi:hypothetical protein
MERTKDLGFENLGKGAICVRKGSDWSKQRPRIPPEMEFTSHPSLANQGLFSANPISKSSEWQSQVQARVAKLLFSTP